MSLNDIDPIAAITAEIEKAEADMLILGTLAASFGQDFGDFSQGLRQGFQNEPISYLRRTEREYVCIKQPRISTIPTAERYIRAWTGTRLKKVVRGKYRKRT